MFGGPEIVQAPLSEQQRYAWSTPRVLDSLPPDVRAVTDEDVRRVQDEARALVRARALQRSRTVALSARGISDFVRFDRVEGLALGGGLTQRIGCGVSVAGRARYGLDDQVAKWQARLEWQNGAGLSIRAFGLRDFRELGEEQERSRALNSIAAQEFASDYTDPYEVSGAGIAIEHAPAGAPLWRVEGAYEKPRQLAVNATPVAGQFLGVVDVPVSDYFRVSIRRERPTALSFFGTELRSAIEVRALRSLNADETCLGIGCSPQFTTVRGSVVADIERPLGSQRLLSHTIAGAVAGQHDVIPAQELMYFGGPVSGAGYEFHQFAARAGLSERLEWRTPIPFFSLPLGRFGTIPSTATFAPYAQVIALAGPPITISRSGFPVAPSIAGAYPAVGAGLLAFFDLVRFDVSRGFRNGRWLFAFDINPEFWSIL